MNSRDLCLGLGLGFIFVSILFFGVFVSANDNDNSSTPSENSMSDDEIIERARNLGMIFIKELPASKDNTLSDDDIINKALDLGMVFPQEYLDDVVSDSDSPSDLDVTSNLDDLSTGDAFSSDEHSSPPVEQLVYVDFVINRGYTARSVAKLLYDKGVIDSYYDFEQFLISKRATTNIRTGTYSLPKFSDYDSVLQALTKRPVH